MKHCHRCGTELSDRAVFCTACGSALPPAVPPWPDVPVGPETLPPVRSASTLGSGRPATYAGVLVPPDPGPRPRRVGRAALVVVVVVALAGGAVLLMRAIGDDGGDEAVPLVADLVDAQPALRPPAQILTVGDEATVRAEDGFAVVELETSVPSEIRVIAPDAVAVIAADPDGGIDPSGGAGPVVDATAGVTSLASGRHRVLVATAEDRAEVDVAITEVARKDLPADNRVRTTLTEDAPVVDVTFSPGSDHAWNLVDDGSADIEAVVHDVTDGSGVEAGDVVCDLDEIACTISGGHDYVLRVTAGKPPVDVDLQFEDRPPTGGPGAVTFDGSDAPLGGQVGAGQSITYELVVGLPDGVTVMVVPVGLWDPEVKVDGKLVSSAGPLLREAIPVDAGVRRTFTVGGGRVGGEYLVTVERR